MRNIIKNYSVEYLQVLNQDGQADNSQLPDLSESKIKEMYHLMVLVRVMDEKLFKLQRSGKIGTYAEVRGQEASEVGSAFALEKNDWMCPSFRETGVFITRGAPRDKIVQGWRGDVRAFKSDSRNLPVAIPVGSQTLYAAGIAWASKLRGEKDVTIVYFGDGATSEGDFHEALNFAGIHKLPIIFFCQNNQWSISTPKKLQIASDTVAQKAIAYDIAGIQVDGNDALGVYKATKEAIDRARNGGGPTLIESVTYRMGDHTTSDDASRYRSEADVNIWKARDPVIRLEKYFRSIGTWNDDYGKWVREVCEKEVDEAIVKALAVEKPGPDELFDYVYAVPPRDLLEQKKILQEEVKQRGL
jgi:pyruvate dehydrogenase E1 component alpha subunit